jgi:uncharacterized membrane protein YczE
MNITVNKSKDKSYKNFAIRIVIALVGVAFVGFGLAFNSVAMLGNDAVAVLYDGVRHLCGLPSEKLGIVTNLVNYTLMVIVFILGRKYINIGTFIYTLPMGNFVDIGFKIHEIFAIPSTLNWRIFTSVCGCSMLFLGIGIFIAIDVGMDPCTGVVMIVRDKINHEYKISKVICDVCTLALGFTFGGKVGVVTVIAALIAGPTIQKISETFDKTVLKRIKLSKLTISNS